MTGALLVHDNILEDALTNGPGAVIEECVAEALANREQLMKDAILESQVKGQPFDKEAFTSTYREKLKPYINASRLIAGSVIAATGRDPTLAIEAVTNALETNFYQTAIAFPIRNAPSIWAGLGFGAATAAAVKTKKKLTRY